MKNEPAKSKRKQEKGQVIALVAMGLVVLIGLAGLATDMGYLYTMERKMQTAADAAAVAAANQYLGNAVQAG
ncbi:MAG TPA: pilus assembly protein TadG-related protein, partial [Candidatus Binataceae bacterium]|nr:pilus assembly protein TadG-related protein [Candidatus Binataceae bacterium]